MTCISPPPLTPLQLSLLLDGEADASLRDHLRHCPACQQTARQMGSILQHMSDALYRITCPSAEQLCQYQSGLLSTAQAKPIAAHLATCPHCAREMLIDYGPAPTEPPTMGVFDQIRWLVAQLLPVGPGPLTPSYSLRGGGRQQPAIHLYLADEVQISIQVEAEPTAPLYKRLIGLLAGIETAGLQVYLWQEDRLCTTTTVDEAGSWTLPHQTPGAYELTFHSPQINIRVPNLSIEA